MESELMPQCGACGSRGTHKVGAETAAPAVGCHCGVIVTGFTEAEATERWDRLSRRAEIGALVERMAVNGCTVSLTESIDLPGPHAYTASFHGDERLLQNGATLLDALRALAAEIGGER